MTKAKHSYVPFYMSDWGAATAGLTRASWSVLFQVCLFNWDKVKPVPRARLKLMVADLPDGFDLVDDLVDAGSLAEDARGVFSPRALAEAEKAFDLWERKSKGGKTARRVMEDSSEESSTEPEPEPEPCKEGEANASPKKVGAAKTPLPILHMIQETWNEMARANDLSPIVKLTDARIASLRARCAEHGPNEIMDAVKTIPDSPFLMGEGSRAWKANFDWLLQPESCAKLIEGTYHNEGRGKGSAWTQ